MALKTSWFCVITLALAFCAISDGQDKQREPRRLLPPQLVTLSKALHLADPFITTVRDKSHTLVFGTTGARGARSSDVQITNYSDKRFVLQSTICTSGGFSSDMFPIEVIEPMTRFQFGVESNGFMTGVRCTVKYTDVDGESSFTVSVHNPYFGKNWSWFKTEGGIQVFDTVGKGNNNQFRFIIRNKITGKMHL